MNDVVAVFFVNDVVAVINYALILRKSQKVLEVLDKTPIIFTEKSHRKYIQNEPLVLRMAIPQIETLVARKV